MVSNWTDQRVALATWASWKNAWRQQIANLRYVLAMATNWKDRRVVVTGLGIVSPLGKDIDTFWNNLVAGRCGVERIASFDPTGFDTQIAAEVKDFDPIPAFPSSKEVRRNDRFSQFGVYA